MLLAVGISLEGQDRDGMDEILRFLGAESVEDMDEEVVERLADFLQRPLKINQVSLSRLIDSGLFDRYRAMSLVDYRSRHGDVLSLTELSLVDGFGEAFAKGLAPFISFEAMMAPGTRQKDRKRLHTDLSLKGGMKYSEQVQGMSGLKARLEYGDNLTFSMALTSPYGQFKQDDLNYTAGIMQKFPKIKSKLLLGDFNARFGQGLAMWNGLSLGSLSSPSALMKNPTGLSLSSSFTGNYAFAGLGLESVIGKCVLTGILALPDLKYGGKDFRILPALNLARYGKYGHLALTHYAVYSQRSKGMRHMSSIDSRWCIRGVDLFGECAFDWRNMQAAAIAGTVIPAGEALRLATVLRYYPASFASEYAGAMYSVSSPSNEYSMSISSELNILGKHRFVFTVDSAYLPSPKKGDRGGSMQLKGLLSWEGEVLPWLTMKARVTERCRTWGEPFRTDARVDMLTEFGDFRVNMRVNALACSELGFLSYVEGGWVRDLLSIWLRQGFFRIDDWNDRIYAYERSAPGSFKVPAYYGRGLWTALTLSSKLSRWCRLYLRASGTVYPFMEEEKRKPGKAELEVYSVFMF